MARLHSDVNRVGERKLPRLEEARADGLVLRDPRIRNLLPCAGVAREALAELVVCRAGHRLQLVRSGRRRPPDRVRERLVLLGRRRHGGGGGQVRALEVGGGEVGDAVPDSCPELGNRLLNGGRVVVRFRLVDFGDPTDVASN